MKNEQGQSSCKLINLRERGSEANTRVAERKRDREREGEELFVQSDVKNALAGQAIDACLRRRSRLQSPHVRVQACPE